MKVLALLAALATASPPALGAPDPAGAAAATVQRTPAANPALVGHYYLSGVMETGSELLLRPDGTFEWYISYGAVDQFAHGHWTSDNTAVVLTVDPQDRTKPLFAALDVEPWSEQAEQELLQRQADVFQEQVAARCPFLADITTDAAVASPMVEPANPPAPGVLRERAATTLAAAQAARSHAEALARAALAGPAAPSHETVEQVRRALAEWQTARWEAQDAARAASLPEPDLADPTLPSACLVPPVPDAAMIPPARWTGGIGVRVVDLDYEQGARDVRVTLHFADGHDEQVKTTSRGLAIRPGKSASPVISVGLAADYAKGRDQAFTVAPTSSGILHFSMDSKQLVAPPFETLRLRIDGAALIPDDMGRGRYERGG